MTDCRLRLRAIEPEDISFITDMENLEDGVGYSQRIAPLSYQSVRTYVMTCDPDPFVSGQLRLLIADDSGDRIGLLDFYDISAINRNAMIGIIIAPEKRNRGLCSRSLLLAAGFARRRLRLETLGALVSVKNLASLRAFGKAGFLVCGTLRKWWRTPDEVEDCNFLQTMLTE